MNSQMISYRALCTPLLPLLPEQTTPNVWPHNERAGKPSWEGIKVSFKEFFAWRACRKATAEFSGPGPVVAETVGATPPR